VRDAALFAVVAVAAGCGDNLARPDVYAAVSGERLALQWYGYTDGTRQPEASEFYDTDLHTRCTPQVWADDVVRCVPVADDVAFADAACTDLIGRAVTIDEPVYFVGHDEVADIRRPVSVYRAGEERAPVGQYFQKQGGVCLGPYVDRADAMAYELLDEIGGAGLVALHEDEVGDGRLALRIRTSDDGMRVPFGLHDRELDVACTPSARPDGSARCEPDSATTVNYYGDPACDQPVVIVPGAAAAPRIARVIEPSGCASFRAIGAEVATPLYQRDGETCLAVGVFPGFRVYAVDGAVELPALGRAVEVVAGRRLQRIVLTDGELRFFDPRLFDTATRVECRRQGVREATRCLPAAVAPVMRLYTSTCAIAAPVAELSPRLCERPGFATALAPGTGDLEIRAIGDPVAEPRYQRSFEQCLPYAPPPGAVLHALGPPIDLTAFPGAIYFGER
jgi:hypothetical protein